MVIANPEDKETQTHEDSICNVDRCAFHLVEEQKVPQVSEEGGALCEPCQVGQAADQSF